MDNILVIMNKYENDVNRITSPIRLLLEARKTRVLSTWTTNLPTPSHRSSVLEYNQFTTLQLAAKAVIHHIHILITITVLSMTYD